MAVDNEVFHHVPGLPMTSDAVRTNYANDSSIYIVIHRYLSRYAKPSNTIQICSSFCKLF